MPHKNAEDKRAYDARYRVKNHAKVREWEKRGHKKYRANMSPEQKQREREGTNRRLARFFANLTPERNEEVRQMRKQATRKFLIKRYGLTHGEFDEMLAAQNGACAICGRTDSGRKTTENLHIDHCHKTGKIRGLLCDLCNNGLGRFCDNPNLLRKAAAYLESQN
jgi:hypothetical protein